MNNKNPGRLTRLFFYLVLSLPALALLGALAVFGLGVWITAILHRPVMYADAPYVVQKFAGSVYWLQRTHWHTVKECVQFDETVLYKPVSGQCTFTNAEFSVPMHFDERTLRRTPAPAATAGDHPRVVILGDSHTMGWGVADEETYASVLASKYGFETLNLGVSSYGTVRELLRLRQSGVLQPSDVIVIQYCNNDLEENRYFLSHGSLRHYTQADFDALIGYKPPPNDAMHITGILVRIIGQDVAKLMRELLHIPRGGAGSKAGPGAAEAFAGVVGSFPEMAGHRILVMEVNGHGYQSSFAQDLAAIKPAQVVVMTPPLAREDFYNMDDHLTAQGHARLAAYLAGQLQQVEQEAVSQAHSE